MALILLFPTILFSQVVQNPLGRELQSIFPELSDGYIDLNQNGELDNLKDMNETVIETRIRDNTLQVQEILDFLYDNYKFLPLQQILSVQDALKTSRNTISQVIALNHRQKLREVIAMREQMDTDGIYLTPTAREKALKEMEGLITELSLAYQKEGNGAESEFVSARDTILSMLKKGYPLPSDILEEDMQILKSTLINTAIEGTPSEYRETAIYTLGRLQARQAVPYLEQLVSEGTIQLPAIRALGEIGNREAQDVLSSTFKETDSKQVRNEIIMALGKIGDTSSLDLILGMLEPNGEKPVPYDTEYAVVKSLSNIAAQGNTDRKILSTLQPYLEHKKPEMRIAAVRGLAAYNDPATSATILKMLNSERNETVLSTLIDAAKEMNNRSAIPSLSNLLENASVSVDIKQEVLTAISKNPNGQQGVHKILPFLGSPSPTLRNAATASLKELYTENSQAIANSISSKVRTSDDPMLQKEGTRLLAELADDSTVTTLYTLLESPLPDVRKNATWGLYRLAPTGNTRIQQSLQELVTSETEPLEVRINSVRALGAIGEDNSRLDIWKTMLTTARMRGEKYSVLRRFAIRTLGNIRATKAEVIETLAKIAAYEQDQTLKLEAVRTLNALGAQSGNVETLLFDLFQDTDDTILQLRILETLGDMRSENAAEAGAKLLKNLESSEYKRLAIYSLYQAKTTDSFNTIIDYAGSEKLSEYIFALLAGADQDTMTKVISRRRKTEDNRDILSFLDQLQANFEKDF